jgi:hypothetical protein
VAGAVNGVAGIKISLLSIVFQRFLEEFELPQFLSSRYALVTDADFRA